MTTMHWITVLAAALGLSLTIIVMMYLTLRETDRLNEKQFKQINHLLYHIVDTELVLSAYKRSALIRPNGISEKEEARTFDEAIMHVAEIIGAEYLGPKLADLVNEDTL